MNEQIDNTEQVYLQKRQQEIVSDLSELILKRNEEQNQIIKSKSGLEKLISADIRFNTGWDDKDKNSLLKMWIEKPGSLKIADCVVANQWLPNNGLSNFTFNIFGNMSIKESFGARLFIRIERQDNFKDSWFYTPLITLKYTDGYTLEKEFEGLLINQNQQNVYVI